MSIFNHILSGRSRHKKYIVLQKEKEMVKEKRNNERNKYVLKTSKGLYYAKLDKATGRCVRCYSSPGQPIEKDALFVSSFDGEASAFCDGWNKKMETYDENDYWIVSSKTIQGRDDRTCDSLAESLVNKTVEHLAAGQAELGYDLDCLTSNAFDTWYIRIERRIYALRVNDGVVTGVEYHVTQNNEVLIGTLLTE